MSDGLVKNRKAKAGIRMEEMRRRGEEHRPRPALRRRRAEVIGRDSRRQGHA